MNNDQLRDMLLDEFNPKSDYYLTRRLAYGLIIKYSIPWSQAVNDALDMVNYINDEKDISTLKASEVEK